VTASIAVWTAHAASGGPTSEAEAFAQLYTVAAAHNASIPKGVNTYAHFGKSVIAHAPLAGIGAYTEADFAAGVPIMALFVEEDGGRFPSGAYIVKVKIEPGSDTGRATLLDAAGHEVASTEAYVRAPDDINAVFPNTYDPPPPVNIPNITSTHVWHNNRWAVDCAGWQPYRVIYY
jgi:hypothetical protein